MATRKVTKFSSPRARILRFNQRGISIAATPDDPIAALVPWLRQHLTESEWVPFRPIVAQMHAEGRLVSAR